MSNKLQQLEFKLEKILGFRNMQEKLEKFNCFVILDTVGIYYIEPQNRQKSLRLIWQRFSSLLYEWIAKISK